MTKLRVGVVGARGHVGAELVPMLAAHPLAELAWVTSQRAVGERVRAPNTSLAFRAADPAILESDPVDALVLALPNGESAAWADAAFARDAIVVDLSGDHRFDDAWTYGRPETNREALRRARRIAVPGCYATAAHLALEPLRDLLAGDVFVFGVSGSSGAGTARSERNDPEVLQGNVLAYGYTDHLHERELRRHTGADVHFLPHVAPFFRGLVVTVTARVSRAVDEAAIASRYASRYEGEPFVSVALEAPRPRDSVGRHDVRIGGFAAKGEGRVVAVVAALDNLLGGAASQAVRALNLAAGLDEGAGVAP